jgi:hypothetical protein
VSSRYTHTQVGWWTVAIGCAIPLILIVASWPPETSIVLPVGLLLLPLAFYSTLTVTVTHEAIEVSFGIGFLKRRIPLSQIRGWRIVRSPLYHGIGMRFIPGGMLYNVRSGPAVELLLQNDRIVRIGSDEPQRLAAALDAVRRPSVPEYAAVVTTVRRARWIPVLIMAFLVAPLALAVFTVQTFGKPPRVTMSNAGMTVKSGLYEVVLPWAGVREVSLEDALPRVERRSNGYALGGTLRGHFRVEGIGAVRLFVQRDHPPFIKITSAVGVVFIGFERKLATERLFREITRVREAVAQ